jgi:membrane associated rhomboid family serine protease
VIGLAVFILYGGIFYGIIPNNPGVSWESHLLGLFIGVILAISYVSLRPTEIPVEKVNANGTIRGDSEVVYHYREKG